MTGTEIIALIGQIIKTAVDVGPTVIKAVGDAEPFALLIYDNLVGGQPITPEQQADIEAQLAVLSGRLQAPLPPEEA